jgi:KUP system potassium uptake protein
VDGKAVFLTSDTHSVPSALLHNLKHNRVVHAQVSLLTVLTEDVPRVPRARRVEVTLLGQGLSRIVARYGFMETANVPHVRILLDANV